jgi:hypothetical protein
MGSWRSPIFTTGQLFLHSCRHFLGLHLQQHQSQGRQKAVSMRSFGIRVLRQGLRAAMAAKNVFTAALDGSGAHLSPLTMAIRVSVSSTPLSFFLGGILPCCP